jgi:hypothetical protein
MDPEIANHGIPHCPAAAAESASKAGSPALFAFFKKNPASNPTFW